MQLHYHLPIKTEEFKISHHQSLVMMGSCFSENVGHKFESNKFNIFTNPYGISFNPLSIAETLLLILNQYKFKDKDIFVSDGAWFSWRHHSKIWGTEKKAFLEKLNQINQDSLEALREADYLIITPGTSFYYELKDSGLVVNNCHKQPSNLFDKKMAEPYVIIEKFRESFDLLKSINPKIKFIFTISPVRHLKEGAFENNVSKAQLFSAVSELLKIYPDTIYFPAYEIMMDELRDYRFYENDYVHPNELAIDIIWERFSDTFFSEETKEIIKKISSVKRSVEHKLFRPETPKSINFIKSSKKVIEELEKTYPFLKFEEEKNYFCTLLEKYIIKENGGA
jgi:hypothetical protein